MQTHVVRFAIAVSMLLAVPAAGAQDSWATRAPMEIGRERHASASLSGYLYVFGGVARAQDDDPRPPNPRFVYDHRMDRYDPVSDSLTRMAPIAEYYGTSPVGWLDAAGVAFGGAIYQFGGTVWFLNSFYWDNSAWKYDVAANAWTQLNNMPGRQNFARAVPTANRIFVVVHDEYAPDTQRTLEFDPVGAGTWVERAALSIPVTGFDLGVADGKAYLVGGEDTATLEWSPATHEYDPSVDAWTRKADMPAGNAYASAASVRRKLFVLGGYAGIYDGTWEYNVIENRWTDARATLPGGRYYATGAVAGTRIHVFGGNDDRPCRLQNYEYTLPTYPRPASPGNVFMRRPAGTPLAEGDWITDILEIGADLSDPDASWVSLEVECVPAAAPFTGMPTAYSPFAPPDPAVAVVSGLTEGAWKWRCRARNSHDEVDAAGWMEFGTNAPDVNVDLSPPSVPVGLSPVNQDVVLRARVGPVEFSWSRSIDNCPLPITYEVEVSTDSDFTSVVAAGSTIDATSMRLDLQTARDSYYWRIRAMDGVGHWTNAWSAPMRFRVTFEDGINHAEGDATRVCGFSAVGRSRWFVVPILLILGGLAAAGGRWRGPAISESAEGSCWTESLGEVSSRSAALRGTNEREWQRTEA